MTDLAWTRDAHGWIAPCGPDGQGEARALPFRGGWAWLVDLRPGAGEPSIIGQDIYVTAADAQRAAAEQVAALPRIIDGARKV